MQPAAFARFLDLLSELPGRALRGKGLVGDAGRAGAAVAGAGRAARLNAPPLRLDAWPAGELRSRRWSLMEKTSGAAGAQRLWDALTGGQLLRTRPTGPRSPTIRWRRGAPGCSG